MSDKTEQSNAQKLYFMSSFSCCKCTALCDLIVLPIRSMYGRNKSMEIAEEKLKVRLTIFK